MKKRINTSLLTLVVVFATFLLSCKQSGPIATFAPPSSTASPASSTAAATSSFDLLSALPASDFIIYVDTHRVLTDIIPAIFVERPDARAKLESELDKLKKEVGFDPRLLDGVAVGMSFNSQNPQGATFALIGRGRFDANAVIDSGLTLATKESRGGMEKRTDVYEGRTLYMLVPTSRANIGPDATKEIESKLNDQTMAFVALDSNTVAFGNLKGVRATIDASLGRGRVDNDLVQLASRTPNAAAFFSGKVSPDMARQLPKGNKELENSIASMKQVYGTINASGGNAEFLINFRMEADEDARKLAKSLNDLKSMAKLPAGQATAERKSIEAIIKNIVINAVGNEVQFTTKLALTDIAEFEPKR